MPLHFVADAGSPLVLIGMFHLLFGNFLIGVLEAAVIWLMFKVKGWRLFAWIITANYASFLAGVFFLYRYGDQIVRFIGGPLPIYALNQILIILVAVTFVITLLVEWPFYWMATRSRGFTWTKASLATLIGNIASYWLLAAIYFGTTDTPAHWGFQLCPSNQIPPNPQVQILFLSSDGANVMQWRAGEGEPTRYITLSEPAPNGGLGIDSGKVVGRYQLMVKKDLEDKEPAKSIGQIAALRATTRPIYSTGEPADDLSWYSGTVPGYLRDPDSPKWEAFLEPGSLTELIITDRTTGNRRIIALLEFPGIAWSPTHPLLLPHNQLAFQFGEQIMIADLDNNLIAAIAPGHSPIVVVDAQLATRPGK